MRRKLHEVLAAYIACPLLAYNAWLLPHTWPLALVFAGLSLTCLLADLVSVIRALKEPRP